MMELLQWLEVLNDLKRVAALSVNSLLLLYLFAYICNRKAAFIVAFLCAEFYGASTFSNSLNDVQFYLGYALIYCLLYCYCFLKAERIRTLCVVVLIVIMDSWSALDAALFPKVETFFYEAYPYLYFFIHCLLLFSLINWRIFRNIMGAVVEPIFSMLGISYRLSFLSFVVIENTFKKNQLK